MALFPVTLLVARLALTASGPLPYDEAKEGATETRGEHVGAGEWMLVGAPGISPLTLTASAWDAVGLTIRAEYQSQWRVWGWLGGQAAIGLGSVPVAITFSGVGSYFSGFAEAGLTIHWSERFESGIAVSLGLGVGRVGTRFAAAWAFGERVNYFGWRLTEGQRIDFLRADIFVGGMSTPLAFFSISLGPAYAIRF